MLEWKDEYKIGIEAVDHEHRELINLINAALELIDQARQSGREAREKVLDRLGDIHGSTSAHFALEERTMVDRSYPDYEHHKADHEDLLDALLDFIDDVDREEDAIPVTELEGRLTDWFSTHFRTQDAKYHGFLRDLS